MSAKRRKYGINSFALHIIAMSSMLCDHLWGTFLGNIWALGYIGRIAFPLFAFMLVEGFFHTSSRKKYALNLLIFAVISEIPFNLLIAHNIFYPVHQNVLFNFLLSFAMMLLFEKTKQIKHIVPRILLYPLITLFFYILGIISFADFYGFGLLTTALFYFTRIHKESPAWKRILMVLIQFAGLYWINIELIGGMYQAVELFGHEFELCMQGFALFALPFIWLYNGEQGPYNKGIKYFYYSFYPVHMLILGGLISWL